MYFVKRVGRFHSALFVLFRLLRHPLHPQGIPWCHRARVPVDLVRMRNAFSEMI